MSKVLVRAERLTKLYGLDDRRATALRVATFEIMPGSRTAIVGASGSGKTTLLQLIAGLNMPTSGMIEWPALDGRKQLRPGFIGMAFQGPSLLPPLTVVENVALPLLIQGAREPEALKEAWGILERMALADIGSHLSEELSGGQSQRVAIARALVTRPALLLADEPTGQQDHNNARVLMDFLISFGDEIGAALVIATHDMEVADRLSIVWSIEDGHLETERSYGRSIVD